MNLSARQLRDRGLVAAVRQALATTGVPGDALCLEITEPVLLCDAEGAEEILHALAALGVSVSVDDFGTGHSSGGSRSARTMWCCPSPGFSRWAGARTPSSSARVSGG